VTANKDIFCTSPWYELHIYWDGSLGICCQEHHKLYPGTGYNIATMGIREWFNSAPVQDFRRRIMGDSRLSECKTCYQDEDHGGHSRRHNCNQKSVIFTKTAFAESLIQSPGQHWFASSGASQRLPIDLHIDLGNYCNLACKMCKPAASTTIAAQHVKWGIESDRQYLGQDWTRDNTVWTRFKHELLDLPGLKNIHFMGGETLLTDRFEDLVDFMIEHDRREVCWSFVTNGTVFKPGLMEKLQQFPRVGIEVSIETLDARNAYQRQGTDTAQVLKNIDRYLEYCNGTSITVALRPAVSALTIGGYGSLLEYALTNNFVIKHLQVTRPAHLRIDTLPRDVRAQYRDQYMTILQQLDSVSTSGDYNASDPNNAPRIVKEQAQLALTLLDQDNPQEQFTRLAELVAHCQRWDQVYGLDARAVYPEWNNLLDQHGYNVSC
jgi:molybdenum cofactor biosynthesis enzyme MoaA